MGIKKGQLFVAHFIQNSIYYFIALLKTHKLRQ